MAHDGPRPGRNRRIVIHCLECKARRVVHRRNVKFCSPECCKIYNRKRAKRKHLFKKANDPVYALNLLKHPMKNSYKDKTDSALIVKLAKLLTRIDVITTILEARGIDVATEDLNIHWKNIEPVFRNPIEKKYCPKCKAVLNSRFRAGKICKNCGFVVNVEILKGDGF